MNLSLGSSGPQVLSLQQILNQSPDTRIASAGPGSPGNETAYFGALTKAAVMRFQQKYANQILVPAGLAQANGFVGSYTRVMLNAISLVATSKANPNIAVTTPSTAVSPSAASVATTTSQNPNLKNAAQFLALIDSVGMKQGLSSDALAKVNQVVLQGLATTTDLRSTFLKQIGAKTNQSAQNNSLLDTALATLGNVFDTVFLPEYAHAQSEGTPFGGALIYSFYCDESDTWLIGVEPLAPSYAVLLTYEPYSQAFSSYNIPETGWLLGFYTGGGTCIVGACPYCYSIPNEGMITSQVGSSPTP